MDSSAIKEIGELAIRAANQRAVPGLTPAIILQLPEGGEKIVSIEDLQDNRARFRGVFTTTSLQAFTGHVIQTAGPSETGPVPGFVDIETMRATAFFNLGNVDNPGHADWYAQLQLKRTAAFIALSNIDGKQLSQKAAAEFLEDWADFIAPAYAGNDSEPGDGTQLKRAVQAVRKLKIKARAESVHEDKSLRTARSAMEEIEASLDDNDLPEGFTFLCEPYLDLPARPFRLGISILTTAEKPSIVLRWKRREANEEAIARDFKRVLSQELDEVATLVIGTFKP